MTPTVLAQPDHVPRKEFLRRRWAYNAGEHVTLLGPTGCGKTRLTWELLRVTASAEVPAVVWAMKPRDSTTLEWAKRLRFATIRVWPPPRRPWAKKSRGWVLWPPHQFDPDIDDPLHEEIFRACLNDCYKRGDRIVACDELLAAVDLHLDRNLRTGWTRGRSMGMGLWGASQKPTHIPTYAYGQAEHLFLFNDPDKRSRDRFDEIGGFDSGDLKTWVTRLEKFECLYIRRTDGAVCVVGK